MHNNDIYRAGNPRIQKGLIGLSQSPHPAAKRIVEQCLRAQEITSVPGAKDLLDSLRGEIRIGYVESPELVSPDSNIIFGIRKEDTPKNVLIFGLSGTGKTNLLLNVLSDLMEATK